MTHRTAKRAEVIKSVEVYSMDSGKSMAVFKDTDGRLCSLQESDVPDQVWVGVDVGPRTSGADNREVVLSRMHLTREQVAHILPYLTDFVTTGALVGDGSN